MPEIPKSNALAEAGTGGESLSELLSRDPEGYQNQDLDRIIEALREQRKKWQMLDSEAKPRAKAKAQAVQLVTKLSPEDLGI